MKYRAHNAGFTLIELLVVMAVLVFLLVIGLGGLSSSQARPRDAKRKTALTNITQALELYYNDHNSYPISTGNTGIGSQAWGTVFADPGVASTVYMTKLPTDPGGGSSYYYTSTDGTYFQLYARLESQTDPDLSMSSGQNLVYTGTDCGLGACNYGVSSTNTTPTVGHPLELPEEPEEPTPTPP